MNSANEIPSLLERYELKFLIPESMIQPISDFVSLYCQLDYHSEQNQDTFYPIYTLYFDSSDYTFLRKRMAGAENRFNMRVRTYDKEEGMPCFFEIKQKRNGIVRKYRTRVEHKEWQLILESSEIGFNTCSEKEKAELFVRLASSYGALPKVLSCYRRKAWVSRVDDYGRVTFDRELRCQREVECNLIPDPYHMSAYDNTTLFDRECSIILELKCYASNVPLWMLDLIRHFNLQRSSFSKYVNSINCLWEQEGYDRGDRKVITL